MYNNNQLENQTMQYIGLASLTWDKHAFHIETLYNSIDTWSFINHIKTLIFNQNMTSWS